MVDSVINNTAPTANAGADQSITGTTSVTLSGSGTDPQNDPLTYSWTFKTNPSTTATLLTADTTTPSFTADVDGIYSIELIVNDGLLNSVADSVKITVTTHADTVSKAINKIKAYADDQAKPKPTKQDYIDAGVTEVTNANLPDVNIRIVAKNTSEVDTTAEIQAVVDSVINNTAPTANAGTDQNVTTGLIVSLNGSQSSDANNDPLNYNWRIISKPEGSNADILVPSRKTVFQADLDGNYVIELIVNDGIIDSIEDTITVTAKSSSNITLVDNAQELLQNEIDSLGDGAIINLDGNSTYLFSSTLYLRNYKNIHINGNGATIKRVDSIETSTTLSEAYTGGTVIYVNDIPDTFKAGDRIVISSMNSAIGVYPPSWIIKKIEDKMITVYASISGEYPIGSTLFKSFYLIQGMFSSSIGGSNPGTIIENIIFDGNGANNNLNYHWYFNGTMYLGGGKSSEIRFNYFKDISNENIIGHGVNVHDNIFVGLNGSAFHTSLSDTTLSLNGLAIFSNNTVIDINRIDKDLNGHSEGAITFSWGAGNLTVKDNLFYSYSGNYGVFGIFAAAREHTDENLTIINNIAYNFEYIIKIYPPPSGVKMNILIFNNIFSNCGLNDFTHLYVDTSIRLGCNTELDNTEIILDDSNSACK